MLFYGFVTVMILYAGMNIPLVNLSAQYRHIAPHVDSAIKNVCQKGDFILGHAVGEFEDAFAKYVGAKYAVGVASGTDGMKLMGLAAGIKPGDEIITQTNTFIATVLPFIELGAKPVFVDCDMDTGAIEIDAVKAAITKKTRAIIPVHLFGRPAPVHELSALARRHKLLVLEDAAQAHGSAIGGKKCGSFGHMAAFSFYPGKNLGAMGDGGAITTNSEKLAETVRIIRNIGQKQKYDHVRLGTNSRLDTIHAAVLSVKLKYLDRWNDSRNTLALRLINGLTGIGDIMTPPMPPKTIYQNYHLFVIRTGKRDRLARFLESRGIHTGIHYPVPLHLTPALKFLGYGKGDFPAAETRAKTMLTLPLYAELKEKEVEYIIKTVRKFYET